MNAKIILDDVSLKFRLYRNPTPTLKDSFINFFTRRHIAMPVSEFYALNHVNLEVNGGDRLGIIGLNGAGKSTLLKMIVGIYPPHQGRIEVHGSITPMIEIGTGFDVELSGRDNIYVNGAILGYSRQEMALREKLIIDFSELGDFIDLPVKYYSSGMYGRLAFSIATMVEPEILLVDEIFSAGDARFVAKGTGRMMDMFKSSQIVVFVSHNLEQVRTLCNRAIVLHKGELVSQGPVNEMIDFYLTNFVKVS
jgi:ABC-type polysaccharide/polyol phosphate transport system ATPase subunit